ncbi:DUF1963 domain-containing protein [Streptomyces cucumeris]|uniref:DUF1963 domain-containing protein n=1 Tax=Streptomyces cucumeris TaxID=2962890 RepID=UPI003EBEDB17
MDDSFDVSALNQVAEALPEEQRQRWLELVRPAVRFRQRGDGDGPAVWRRNGLPELPDVVPWPVWEGHGPMTYAGTIDCAGLPRHSLGIPLPEDGTLLFFVSEDWSSAEDMDGAENRAGTRVMYVPASATTRPRQKPEGLPDLPEGLIDPSAEEEFLVVDRVFPSSPDSWTRMVSDLGIPEECEDVWARLHDLDHQFGSFQAQVGGHPHWAQFPCLPDSTGLRVPEEPEYPSESEHNWLLLATFPDAMDGTLYWMIHRGDLTARRFDQAVLIFQC